MTEETRIVEDGTAAEVAVVEAAEAETTTAPAVETPVAEVPVAEVVVEAATEAVAEVVAEASEEVEVMSESVVEAVAETTEAVADEAGSAVEAVAEVVQESVPAVEAASEGIVESVSNAVSATVEAVTEKVEEMVESVSEAATETAEAATEKVADAVETVTEKISAVVAEVTGDDEEGDDGAEGGDRRVVRLSVGQEVKGTIKRITDFGAFVDIGAGRDGLIHISEMAVGRVNQVADVVQAGQEMTLWIKKLDRARNRISLRLISPDTKTIKDINDGDVVPGTVARLVPYGAFIDIGVGTDALLHVREMSNNYVAKPEDVVKIGETLDVRILTVNRRRRRIDVSLKGLRDEPEPEMAEMAQAAAALGVKEDEEIVDSFENVQVLSPMELAFKRAMEAEGVEVEAAATSKRRGGRGKKNRSMQDEIIRRTLETMRE
jgi:small subunit ribosomal protein S1